MTITAASTNRATRSGMQCCSSRRAVRVFAGATGPDGRKLATQSKASRACQVAAVGDQEASVRASRRAVLLSGLALVGGSAAAKRAEASEGAAATSAAGVRFEDAADKFSLVVPSGWASGEGAIEGSQTGFGGATGVRRTIAWFPTDGSVSARDVNVSLVITNVSFEFTKLGSFGNVATFASNLVNSLDRSYLLNAPSWARRSDEPVQVARLVDYKESRGQYFVEYTVQKLPEAQRHLLSTVALGSNGRYNRLYTVTAQCPEELLPQYRPQLEAVLNSFVANVQPMA
uniref:PsbP C-terminal domain-containing protein n=1 Tax=Chlamydomonas leiostraca TaxID=1034604 RepID=A0A7S0WYF0_9CHLO|mmetsp:Transcript_34772/g.88062  ORF Transcript_34772/g.88062 Transcript_34772/m.88062 type:complete len:287 (+) Transcript_34772:94-954(+)|eukprot:CAMPEP_0202865358 /NCGR_PEP_ID=MMETSP1391-20130828/5791_1 /ASSEMBLY_ACC=CAM_ASM_000867 /TAXON_ID=1034604 /ORGANISM="Chlamydomonas leiostraca, Strain SAG 11-49" /LENGTH=286 /DNA_ID=CAMNT_0049545193 /DNA_START=89 /DNA_END=949 /DNA_ORIENTATION=-